MSLAALVLAAGRGNRLRPLTDLLPKPLCPVLDRPLVDWTLDQAEAVTGDVTVNVHYLRELLERHLAGRARLSVEEPEALGTAGAAGRIRDHVGGRALLVLNSDSWRPGDLGEFVDGWDGERVRLLAVRDPGRGDFGDLRYAGACLLPWRDVTRLEPVPSGLYEACWRQAEAAGRLELVETGGPFVDCGTPRDYLAANLAASGGRSVVGAGAVVEGEVVRSVVWRGAAVRRGERLVESVRAASDVTVAAWLSGHPPGEQPAHGIGDR